MGSQNPQIARDAVFHKAELRMTRNLARQAWDVPIAHGPVVDSRSVDQSALPRKLPVPNVFQVLDEFFQLLDFSREGGECCASFMYNDHDSLHVCRPFPCWDGHVCDLVNSLLLGGRLQVTLRHEPIPAASFPGLLQSGARPMLRVQSRQRPVSRRLHGGFRQYP